MMRSPGLHYWVESPHLFRDPSTANLVSKDLEKAEKLLKEAPSRKDAMEQVNGAYQSMYCCMQALLHSIQYKTTHMRCIFTIVEDYFIAKGILESVHLNNFLRGLKIEGTPQENAQAAEAMIAAVKKIVGK